MFGLLQNYFERRAQKRWDSTLEERIDRLFRIKPNVDSQISELSGYTSGTAKLKKHTLPISDHIWIGRTRIIGDIMTRVYIAEHGDMSLDDATEVFHSRTIIPGAWQEKIIELLDQQIEYAEVERREFEEQLALRDLKRANLSF